MSISKTTFEGLNAVEVMTDSLRLVAVTDFGPRIAFLGKPNGTNVFLWEPGKRKRKDWDLRGGHRVWVTRPGADECEDTYATDNDPCDVQVMDNGFRVVGAENKVNATRRGIEVTMRDDCTLDVDNFVVNTGSLLYSGGVWALTCTIPTDDCRYCVPVGDGTAWDNFTMVHFREWAGQGQGGFNDDQFVVGSDLVTLVPRGIENKKMLQSHTGIVAFSDAINDVTFAKKVGYDRARPYPLNTNIALYVGPDNFMVEMETMGPETTLKPGDELHHIETWRFVDGARALDDAASVTQLFSDLKRTNRSSPEMQENV
ncbi:MAG: hypothetical protein K9N51_00670 [Candidatus Pacebacteria bacterium]|nr:hypothetical protein [Candidatus Paceibacterota bacterium]